MGATLAFPRLNCSLTPASLKVFLLLIPPHHVPPHYPLYYNHICLIFCETVLSSTLLFWSVPLVDLNIQSSEQDRAEFHFSRLSISYTSKDTFLQKFIDFPRECLCNRAANGSGGLVSSVGMTAEHYWGWLIASDLGSATIDWHLGVGVGEPKNDTETLPYMFIANVHHQGRKRCGHDMIKYGIQCGIGIDHNMKGINAKVSIYATLSLRKPYLQMLALLSW